MSSRYIIYDMNLFSENRSLSFIKQNYVQEQAKKLEKAYSSLRNKWQYSIIHSKMYEIVLI